MNKKVAIVTGGSSGIGKSTALELAKRGIGVIPTYNSDKKGAEAIVQDIEQQSAVHAVALKLDLSGSRMTGAVASKGPNRTE